MLDLCETGYFYPTEKQFIKHCNLVTTVYIAWDCVMRLGLKRIFSLPRQLQIFFRFETVHVKEKETRAVFLGSWIRTSILKKRYFFLKKTPKSNHSLASCHLSRDGNFTLFYC